MRDEKKWFIVLIISFLIIIPLNKFVHFINYREKNFKIPGNIETYIFGASQAQASLNPEIINNSINLSLAGEKIFLTNSKIKFFLNNNNPNSIILTISPYSFSDRVEKISVGDMVYFGILDEKAKKIFKKKNIVKYLWCIFRQNYGIISPGRRDVETFFRIILKRQKITRYPFIAGFEYSSTVYTGSKTSIRGHFYNGDKIGDISKMKIDSFREMLEYISEKKIKLILLRTPKHNNYISQVPDYFEKYFEKEMEMTLSKYKNVTYFNFENYKLPMDSYKDADHLNQKGAKLFSTEINRILNNKMIK